MEELEPLVRRVLTQGDRTALSELVEATQGRIYGFVLRRLGNAADAEDATQEVFRQMLESLGSLRDPCAFRAWIFRIACRVAQRACQLRERDPRSGPLPAQDCGEPVTRGGNQDLHDRVRAAVAALDEDLQTVIQLRYEQGLRYDEIAGALECPEGTISKRLHVAHRRLQQVLATAGFALSTALLSEALAAAASAPVSASLASRLAETAREAVLPTAIVLVPTTLKLTLGLAGALGLLLVATSLFRLRPEPKAEGAISAIAPATARLGKQGRVSSANTGTTSAAGFLAPATVGVLVGRVIDHERLGPVAGAQIEVRPKGDETELAPARATSDARGTFALRLAPGEYEIDALAAGYVRFSIGAKHLLSNESEGKENSITVRADETTDFDVELVPAAEIHGTVLDPKGHPIEGVEVHLEAQRDYNATVTVLFYTPDFEGDSREVRTDADGRFVLSHLMPKGTCHLDFQRTDYEPLSEAVLLTGHTVHANFVLHPGLVLSGRVVDSFGRAIAGAFLFAGTDTFVGHKHARTNDTGWFELRDQPRTTRWLVGYAPGHGMSFKIFDASEASSLSLVLPPASHRLTGRVVDESGNPLEDVQVVVPHFIADQGSASVQLAFRRDGKAGSCSESVRHDLFACLPEAAVGPAIRTSPQGSFELPGLAQGPGIRTCVQFQKEGYAPVERICDQAPWIQIILRKAAPISPDE